MKSVLHFRDVYGQTHGGGSCRISDLRIRAAECCVMYGVNPAVQDLLVRFATGASVPDHGSVSVLGTNAADCDETLWFQLVKQIAVVDPGVPLPASDSIGKYLAGAFLAVNPLMGEPDLSRNVLRASARANLTIAELSGGLFDAPPRLQWKARLGRALALDPDVLIIRLENAQAEVLHALPRLLRRARRWSRLSIVSFVSDAALTAAIADRVVFLNPHTGNFIEKKLRGWYHSLFSFIGTSPAVRLELAATIARDQTNITNDTRRV